MRIGSLESQVEMMNRPLASGHPVEDNVRLTDVPLRRLVELHHIDLPERQAEPLFECGLVPGCRLSRVRDSPAGDPILLVEGTLLALRRETARQIFVRSPGPDPA